jgi:hypothetical protein
MFTRDFLIEVRECTPHRQREILSGTTAEPAPLYIPHPQQLQSGLHGSTPVPPAIFLALMLFMTARVIW